MYKHSFTMSGLTAPSACHTPSTMFVVALLAFSDPKQSVEMASFVSGPAIADLLNEIGRVDAQQGIVGLQFAIPPQLNGSKKWAVAPVHCIARARIKTRGDEILDTFAYRLATDAVFIDNQSIDPAMILEWRSLYDVRDPDGTQDPQSLAYEEWLSVVLTKLVNAVNLPNEAECYL